MRIRSLVNSSWLRLLLTRQLGSRQVAICGYLVVLAVFACVGYGCKPKIEINTNYDQGIVTKRYTSFRWYPEIGYERKGRARHDKALDVFLRREIELSFQELGMAKLDNDSADLMVVYHAALEEEITFSDLSTFYASPYGPRFLTWSNWTDLEVKNRVYPLGTLLIDVIDVKEKKLIWRASSQLNVDRYGDVNANQSIASGVFAIVSKFPPTVNAAK